MVEIASPGSVIKPPSHSYSGSYGTAARPQEGRPGSGVRLHPQSELRPVASPEMPSPTVCNTNSVTLSTTWPPVSDGSHSVHKASRFGKGQCLTGTQTNPGLSLPSTPQQGGPWLFLVLSALPSNLPERDAQHLHPWDMSAEADTADGTKSAGWISVAPHGLIHQHRLLRCQPCRLLQSQLSLSSPSFKPQDLASSGWH